MIWYVINWMEPFNIINLSYLVFVLLIKTISRGVVCTLVHFIRYSAMVFEALSTIKDPNGSDINDIVRFIEVRWSFVSLFGNIFLYLTTCYYNFVDWLNALFWDYLL